MQDIITGMQRHNDLIPLILYPATVQGSAAVEQILYALHCVIAENRCDILIIARGGGASETLAVFNDERLLRAVAVCPVPVISAVGHDVDITLLDEVADIRAATPTAAHGFAPASITGSFPYGVVEQKSPAPGLSYSVASGQYAARPVADDPAGCSPTRPVGTFRSRPAGGTGLYHYLYGAGNGQDTDLYLWETPPWGSPIDPLEGWRSFLHSNSH